MKILGRPAASDRMVFWGRVGDFGALLSAVGAALTCFSGLWSYVGSPLPLDRALLFVGLALSTVSFTQGVEKLRLRPLHMVLLGASLFGILSVLSVTPMAPGAVIALVDRYGLLPFFLAVSAPVVYGTARRRLLFCTAFAVLGFYLGLTAIAEGLSLNWLVWPKYILDPSVGIHSERARGPYVEAVANGVMLTFCGLMICVRLRFSQRRAARLVLILSGLMCVVGIVFTLTRAVWLGAAACGLFGVLATPRLRQFTLPICLAGGLSVLGLFLTVPGLADESSQRSASELPVWDRLNTNAAAWRMLMSDPLTGVGWLQSEVRMSEFVRQADTYPVTSSSGSIEVHNLFLSRLAELGLIGAATWGAALFSVVGWGILRVPSHPEFQVWRLALGVFTVDWLIAALFGPMSYAQPNYVLWLMGGLVLSEYLVPRQIQLGRSLR